MVSTASPAAGTQAHPAAVPYPPSTLRTPARVEDSGGPPTHVRPSGPSTRGWGQLHVKLPRVFTQP